VIASWKLSSTPSASVATASAPPAGLYNYAKALEEVEAGLLGGFFYKHFRLAASVIGSNSRGTMRSTVAALKRTYEVALFPQLDSVRWGRGGAAPVVWCSWWRWWGWWCTAFASLACSCLPAVCRSVTEAIGLPARGHRQ
jgi:hypothetical protein